MKKVYLSLDLPLHEIWNVVLPHHLIRVTTDHLRRGEEYDCEYGPIALAVREQTVFKEALVATTFVHIRNSDLRIFPLPPIAIRLGILYDEGYEVRPFSFFLALPSPGIQDMQFPIVQLKYHASLLEVERGEPDAGG